MLGQGGQRDRFEHHSRQGRGVAVTPSGVQVDRGDQFRDRFHAVADDPGGFPTRGGDELAGDDQQAMVRAGREPLDDDARRFLTSVGVGRDDLLAGRQVGRHPSAVVAEARLHDDRPGDLPSGGPGVVGVGDRAALGDRHADLAEEVARQFLVLGDRLGDCGGAVGLRRVDPPLARALSEQDQAVGVQPAGGNSSGLRGGDDRAGARPELDLVQERAEAADFGLDVVRTVMHGGEAKLSSGVEAGPGELLFLELNGDLVHAFLGRLTGAAKPDRRAGEGLEFQRHVLKDVRLVRPPSEPFEETAAFADAATVLDH